MSDPERICSNCTTQECTIKRECPHQNFTCNNCNQKEDCEWAFDLYNCSGDCLALK